MSAPTCEEVAALCVRLTHEQDDPPYCREAAAALTALQARADIAADLLAALEGLLADIQDYQRINKLGGEDNHWQVIARAAIARAKGGAA